MEPRLKYSALTIPAVLSGFSRTVK